MYNFPVEKLDETYEALSSGHLENTDLARLELDVYDPDTIVALADRLTQDAVTQGEIGITFKEAASAGNGHALLALGGQPNGNFLRGTAVGTVCNNLRRAIALGGFPFIANVINGEASARLEVEEDMTLSAFFMPLDRDTSPKNRIGRSVRHGNETTEADSLTMLNGRAHAKPEPRITITRYRCFRIDSAHALGVESLDLVLSTEERRYQGERIGSVRLFDVEGMGRFLDVSAIFELDPNTPFPRALGPKLRTIEGTCGSLVALFDEDPSRGGDVDARAAQCLGRLLKADEEGRLGAHCE